MKLYRIILPVTRIDTAAEFYAQVLQQPGRRVSPGRHYFDCEGTILACYSSREDGDAWDVPANPEHIYLAADDLESVLSRCSSLQCKQVDANIKTQPWGERSFYAQDPFGNKLCFVDQTTVFVGEYALNSPSR